MTTLPQTTQVRSPKVASQVISASPQAILAPPPSGFTGGDVWRVIRSNLWLIVLLTAAGGAAGFFLHRHLAQYYPRYKAVGTVYVLNRPSANVLDPVNVSLEAQALAINQQTQAIIMMRQGLLDDLLRDRQVRDTEWFKTFVTPVGLDTRLEELVAFTASTTPDFEFQLQNLTRVPVKPDPSWTFQQLIAAIEKDSNGKLKAVLDNPGVPGKTRFIVRETDPATVPLRVNTIGAGVLANALNLTQQVTGEEISDPVGTIRSRDFLGIVSLAEVRQDLTDRLAVSPKLNTRLIQVSFTYKNPEDCRTIVNRLVDLHLDSRSRDRFRDRDRLMKPINDRLSLARQNLRNATEQVGAAVQDLNIDDRGTSIRMTTLVQRQLDLDREYREAVQAQAQTDSLYQSVYIAHKFSDPEGTKERAPNDKDYYPTEIESMLAADEIIKNMRYELRQREAVLDNMLSQNIGVESTGFKQAKNARDNVEKKLKEEEQDKKSRLRVDLFNRIVQQKQGADKRVELLKDSMAKNEETIKGLSIRMNQFIINKARVVEIEAEMRELLQQQSVIARIYDQQESVGIDWADRAMKPDRTEFPKRSVIIPSTVIAGFLLALGIAFLRAFLDTTVNSPRDIARVGQMNLLGIVPDENDDPQATGARLPLVIFDAPQSATAEQLRQVRTRLQHAASLDTNRSILVTSPGPGDGKTTIACNLAAGLALNGRRILLVDANFRRPELHKTFGIANTTGFGDVLNAIENFDAAVQATQVPNLSVLPAGPKPGNTTELLESQLLNDFIDRALQEYDHVIFDSGPLLFVSETVALAPRVDGVITVVRARSNTRGVLQRTRDQLRQLKAEHLGVVLNAVRAQAGGYYGRSIKTYYRYQSQD